MWRISCYHGQDRNNPYSYLPFVFLYTQIRTHRPEKKGQQPNVCLSQSKKYIYINKEVVSLKEDVIKDSVSKNVITANE